MNCLMCGGKLKPNNRYCTHCGLPVVCINCKSSFDAEDKYCGKCGNRLYDPNITPVEEKDEVNEEPQESKRVVYGRPVVPVIPVNTTYTLGSGLNPTHTKIATLRIGDKTYNKPTWTQFYTRVLTKLYEHNPEDFVEVVTTKPFNKRIKEYNTLEEAEAENFDTAYHIGDDWYAVGPRSSVEILDTVTQLSEQVPNDLAIEFTLRDKVLSAQVPKSE